MTASTKNKRPAPERVAMQTQPHVPDNLKQYCPLTGFEIFWRIVSPLLPFAALLVAIVHVYRLFMRNEPWPVRVVIAIVYAVVMGVLWKTKTPGWRKTIEEYAQRNVYRYWLVLKRTTGSNYIMREIMQTAAVRGICSIHGTSYLALPLCRPDKPSGFMGFVNLDPDLRQDLEGIQALNQGSGLRHWEVCLERFNEDELRRSTVWAKHWQSETWTLFTVDDLLEFAVSGLPDRYDGLYAATYLAIIIRVYRNETERLNGTLERIRTELQRQVDGKRLCLEEMYRCWKMLLPIEWSAEAEAARKGRHAMEDFLLSQLPAEGDCRLEIEKYVAEDGSRHAEQAAVG
jgi:hypothetical protein